MVEHKKRPRLAIVGAGALGRQISHHARRSGQYQVVGFFDDSREVGSDFEGVPVLGAIESLERQFEQSEFDELLIGIGYNHMAARKNLFEQFQAIPFGTIVAADALVDPGAKLGSGVVIYPGCIVDVGVSIEDNVLLNLGVIISHDSQIGAHSFLAPGVKVAGFSKVGKQCNLGIGTIIKDEIELCAGVRTGAGAVVTKDVTYAATYVGVPARPLRDK